MTLSPRRLDGFSFWSSPEIVHRNVCFCRAQWFRIAQKGNEMGIWTVKAPSRRHMLKVPGPALTLELAGKEPIQYDC
jgi:hypothetical protein